jgi:hypothetical protein
MKKLLFFTALVAMVCSVNGQNEYPTSGNVVADGYTFPDGSGLIQSSRIEPITNLAPDCFNIGAIDGYEAGLFDGIYTGEVGTDADYVFNEPTYVTTIKVYIGPHWNGSGSIVEEPTTVSCAIGGTNTSFDYEEEGVYTITVNATIDYINLYSGDLYFQEIEVFGQEGEITTAAFEGDFIFNGNVGIGTDNPQQQLHVNGDSYLQGKVFIGSEDTYFYRDAANRIKTNDMFYVGTESPATYLYSTNTYLGYTSGNQIHLRGNTFDWTSGGGGIINAAGNVGIGTTTPTSKLTVDGKIECEEIEVKLIAADYVFEADYNLRSLEEVESFIIDNGHLPDVAPASQTVKGVELAKFNTLLLQKIEELTLYMIDLKKENEAMKELVNSIR